MITEADLSESQQTPKHGIIDKNETPTYPAMTESKEAHPNDLIYDYDSQTNRISWWTDENQKNTERSLNEHLVRFFYFMRSNYKKGLNQKLD